MMTSYDTLLVLVVMGLKKKKMPCLRLLNFGLLA